MKAISWFSCGAASAVATKLLLTENPLKHKCYPVHVVYCDTKSEHEDNRRFLQECSAWFGQDVEVIENRDFDNVDDVIENRKYLAGIKGAPCTTQLKRVPRFNYQEVDDLHIFGYTTEERKRAERFRENQPELDVRFPLIERGINKNDCLAIIKDAGIELPIMYKLGFEHNNCIGCVKSGSAKYWNLIRNYFPDVFKRRCEQSRKYGARLLKLKNHETGEWERYFLDELPNWDYYPDEPEPTCDFLCQSISKEVGPS